MPKYKGVEIDTKPNQAMKDAAAKGLKWREEYGRGGTAVGVARARDIVNGKTLSLDTVKRMNSFFARHEVDKQAEGFSPGEKGYPSAGAVSWALWGGNPGQSFARRITNKMKSLDERSAEYAIFDEISEERTMTDMTEINDEEITIESSVEPSETEESVQESIEEAIEEAIEDTVLIDSDEEERNIEVIHRSMTVDAKPINEDERRVNIAISSEEPVERSFGKEVLEHSDEAIDLSFLASGRAPLLLDHDPKQQIGVIESVDLDGSARRLRATVRFGRNGLAKEVFDDVVDGIRANISVGYTINKMEKDSSQRDTYIAKAWRPMEASLVSIPADVTVGVGRSNEQSKTQNQIVTHVEDIKMSEVDMDAIRADAQKEARKNASEIAELGARHNQGQLAQQAIRDGKSIEEFRSELLEVVGSVRGLENDEIGMTKEEVKRFSLARAIHALANPTDRRAQEAAAFEFECSRVAADQTGRASQGIMLPNDVLRNWTRDLNSSDDSHLHFEDGRPGDFIDVLRNSSSVMQAGARMLTGLSGDVKIPKKTAGSSASWIATEGGAAGESEMVTGSITMSPKSLGAFTDVTRQLLIQSSLDIEALIRDDLAQALALAIDLGALSGSGASGQPTGIKNTSGINTVDFGTAPDLVPTWAQVIEMETKVAEDNALLGANLAYISNATMYGALKSVTKDSGSGQFVVEPNGNMNGYRTIVSNQVASGDLYFGNFADLLIGFFGNLDLLVDPYTASTTGTIRVVALQSVDVAVRNAVSFCLGNDGGS